MLFFYHIPLSLQYLVLHKLKKEREIPKEEVERIAKEVAHVQKTNPEPIYVSVMKRIKSYLSSKQYLDLMSELINPTNSVNTREAYI